MNEQEITDIVKSQLKEHFPLFKEEREINVSFHEGNLLIGYRTNSDWSSLKGSTRFDIQIINSTCFTLWTEIEEEQRGRGYGKAMYTAIENIAKKLGCSTVRGTFSGTTNKGEPKIENVHKWGYTRISEIEAEKIL